MIYLDYNYPSNKNNNNNYNLQDYYKKFPAYNSNHPSNSQRKATQNSSETNYTHNQRQELPYMPSQVDQGPTPYSMNISVVSLDNDSFRQAICTGQHLQVTIMSIEVGGEIGYEVHSNLDQLLYIEQGEGLVVMGANMDNMDYQESVYDGYSIFIPAGTMHNLINEGEIPIKLFSVYAPPAHPHGTVHETVEDAMEDEHY